MARITKTEIKIVRDALNNKLRKNGSPLQFRVMRNETGWYILYTDGKPDVYGKYWQEWASKLTAKEAWESLNLALFIQEKHNESN